MRNPLAAALVGTPAGVSAAGATLALTARLLQGASGFSLGPPAAALMTTAILAGPGAFLLGLLLAVLLHDQMHKGATRGRVLAFGLLWGLPLGPLNLLGVLLFIGGASEIPSLFTLADPIHQSLAAGAFAGGAGLGLGCAWWISLPRKVPA